MSSLSHRSEQATCRFARAMLVVLLAVSVAAAGCEGPKKQIVEVSGRVTLDDAPLTGASVSFVSPSGYVSAAPLDADGRYRLTSQYGEGIPPGEYRIAILPQRQIDPTNAASMRGSTPAKSLSPIPVDYQFPHRSGLTAIVGASNKVLNFALHAKSP